MNHWTELSMQFASQSNYLDELYKVYPIVPDVIREIDEEQWNAIEQDFNNEDKLGLIKNLLSLKLFPIKDSFVAYLRRDPDSLDRNPETVNRIYGRLRELGLEEIYKRCSEPKETNRQIGPLFGRWLRQGVIGVDLLSPSDFLQTENNAILDANDAGLKSFASEHLNYQGEKGLDFVGKFNGQYVVGEAKFLTDFGGHQNAQFEDAKNLLKDQTVNAIKVGILDGVLYINGNNKMNRYLREHEEQYNIISSLVLREFLFSI